MFASLILLLICAFVLPSNGSPDAIDLNSLRAVHIISSQQTFSFVSKDTCLVQCNATSCCNTGGPCAPGGCCNSGEQPCSDGFGCCPAGACSSQNGLPTCLGPCSQPSTPCSGLCCDAGFACSQQDGKPICVQGSPSSPGETTTLPINSPSASLPVNIATDISATLSFSDIQSPQPTFNTSSPTTDGLNPLTSAAIATPYSGTSTSSPTTRKASSGSGRNIGVYMMGMFLAVMCSAVAARALW